MMTVANSRNYFVSLLKTLLTFSFIVALPLIVVANEFQAVGLTLGESVLSVVAKFEEKKIPIKLRSEDSLTFSGTLVKIENAKETELEFYKEKLIRIRINLKMPNDRFQDFLEHYGRLKGALTEKYGRPTARKELIARSFNGNLSPSMLEGEIGYGVIFRSDDVEIKLMLKNLDRRKYQYFLEYEDLMLKKEKEEVNETIFKEVL